MARKRMRGNNDCADVASELGITKASLHYHSRGTAELGLAYQGARGEPAGAPVPPRRVSGEAVEAILSGLEGAMLVARPYGDVGRVEAAARP